MMTYKNYLLVQNALKKQNQNSKFVTDYFVPIILVTTLFYYYNKLQKFLNHSS